MAAIVRQFEGSAHLSAKGAFFIRNQLVAAPMSRDLLVGVIGVFGQLPPVGVEGQLAKPIVGHIDFWILEVDAERFRGMDERLHFRIVRNVFPPPPGGVSGG